MDGVKTGLSHQEKITQKQPGKEAKQGQKMAAQKRDVNPSDRPGKFKVSI